MITLTEIQSVATPEQIAERDEAYLAALVSAGRTKIVPTEIGKGKVIAAIGLESANPLLDVIDTQPDFRHVKHLLANGWLDVGDAQTRGALDMLATAGACTQAEADAIKALAVVADPVSVQDILKALES